MWVLSHHAPCLACLAGVPLQEWLQFCKSFLTHAELNLCTPASVLVKDAQKHERDAAPVKGTVFGQLRGVENDDSEDVNAEVHGM